ncbi:MAG TPA: phage tail sheath C-terminal domain-containing protein [Thermoanaerobaculia bacterium]|nr:phage tail sheath C-terminal domain-containing protein [Thermoanaerobaculia bacterium]
MPTYLRPGVYIEEISSGSKPIEGVGTSTAAFVGYTTKGDIGQPTLIFKWDDYENLFGGIRNTGKDALGDPMGHSVSAFFQNGGTAAYIVRLASGTPVESEGFLEHPDDDTQLIRFRAVNPGTWADGLRVRFTPKPGGGGFNVVVGRGVGNDFKTLESFSGVSAAEGDPNYVEGRINGQSNLITAEVQDVSQYQTGTSTSGDLTGVDFSTLVGKTLGVTVDGTSRSVLFEAGALPQKLPVSPTLADVATVIQNRVRGSVTIDLAVKNFEAAAVGNTLVLTSGVRSDTASVVVANGEAATTLKLGANGEDAVELTGGQSLDAVLSDADDEVELTGGNNGSAPTSNEYNPAFAAFEKIRAISMISLPGQTWGGTSKAIVQAAVGHAEKMRNRMVLVDPPLGTELRTESDVNSLGLPTSTYTTLYYPWVKVVNPYFNAEKNPGVPVTVLAPPSGYAAGMWSRIDGRRGVWKAPAGVETALLGVAGLEFQVEDGEQEQLNPMGVNCFRTLPSFGPVIWGTRTLSTNADPEWRYVPVRRTAIFIEQSVFNGIQWAVFEPNDHRLWSSLRVNIDSFMNGLFRSGAFQGQKASDAYFVRCGLGDTMTQGDIDRGQVIVIVGFAPLKPAEFVIVRIQQKVGQ